MNYEDFKQLSKDIKATEKIILHANTVVIQSNVGLREQRQIAKALKHLTKMKHILDRQLHVEHLSPELGGSHDLFF